MIKKSVVVTAPRTAVWKAWTTPAGLTSFLAPAAHVELRPGGPFEIFFVPDAPQGARGSEGCRILSYLPEQMLAFS